MDLEDNSEEREEIRKLIHANYMSTKIEELNKYHVYTLKSWQEFNTPCECREWVFNEMGLAELTLGKSDITFLRLGKKLEAGEIRQLKKIEYPVPGALVAYFDIKSFSLESYIHYGVCSGFINDRIMVDSKWGNLHLFRHDINSILSLFGDKADFFQKVNYF
jgi:hypothetical protein